MGHGSRSWVRLGLTMGHYVGHLCFDLRTGDDPGGSSCRPRVHLLLQRGHDGQLHPESHQPGAQQVLFGLGWVAMLRTFHQVRHSLRDLQRIWKHHWIPCARDQEANCFGKFSEGLNQHSASQVGSFQSSISEFYQNFYQNLYHNCCQDLYQNFIRIFPEREQHIRMAVAVHPGLRLLLCGSCHFHHFCLRCCSGKDSLHPSSNIASEVSEFQLKSEEEENLFGRLFILLIPGQSICHLQHKHICT